MTRHIKITGYVVGPIWWPVGAECFKEFHYDLNRESARYGDPAGLTLRDHVLRITADGDFQNAGIAQGEVHVTRQCGSRRVTRTIPLGRFARLLNIDDCLHEDPDE